MANQSEFNKGRFGGAGVLSVPALARSGGRRVFNGSRFNGYFVQRSVTSDDRAIIVIIADAMVDALEAATLSQSFDVSRGYVFIRDIIPVGTEVLIEPSILSVSAFDLGPRHAWDWQVAAWVRRRTNDQTVIDGLMLLCQEITELFATKTLAGTRARCIGVESRPGHDPTRLDTERVFNAGIVFTFRMTK